MILSAKAIEIIKPSTRIKTGLALVLNKSAWTVERLVNANDDNGPLTTMAAINLIKKETGLKQSEILKEQTIEAANK